MHRGGREPYSGAKSVCCGDNFYPHISIEEVTAFQKEARSSDALRRRRGLLRLMHQVHVHRRQTPHHMLDLTCLASRPIPQETRIDVYHETLDQYVGKRYDAGGRGLDADLLRHPMVAALDEAQLALRRADGVLRPAQPLSGCTAGAERSWGCP